MYRETGPEANNRDTEWGIKVFWRIAVTSYTSLSFPLLIAYKYLISHWKYLNLSLTFPLYRLWAWLAWLATPQQENIDINIVSVFQTNTISNSHFLLKECNILLHALLEKGASSTATQTPQIHARDEDGRTSAFASRGPGGFLGPNLFNIFEYIMNFIWE